MAFGRGVEIGGVMVFSVKSMTGHDLRYSEVPNFHFRVKVVYERQSPHEANSLGVMYIPLNESASDVLDGMGRSTNYQYKIVSMKDLTVAEIEEASAYSI